MPHRGFVWLLGATAACISMWLWVDNSSATSRLEEAMALHGLTAANVVYGRVESEPEYISVNAPGGIVRPYYSLAKPMTAAVALQVLDIEQTVEGATVRQLLQHTGGWDRTIQGDPVTASNESATCTQLPVPEKQFPPGERYAYSNIGYCLIGRAVAQATGTSFPDAVQSLFPEAQSMQYDPWLGPAGGWSGTAYDFFRFALRHVPTETIVNPHPRSDDVPYGLGWGVGPDYLVHFGALKTNFALVVKQGDFAAVGIFDGRPGNDAAAAQDLRKVFLELNEAR